MLFAHVGDPAPSRASEAMAAALRRAGSAAVIEPRPWPFLQSTTVPTVMIELAFLTRPVERRLVQIEASTCCSAVRSSTTRPRSA